MRPAEPGKRRGYKPLVPSKYLGMPGYGGGARGRDAAFKILSKPVKPKTSGAIKPPAGPNLNDIFGLVTEAEMEKSAHDSAASAIASKAKAIDDAIQAEKDRTQYNVDLMRQVYAEFATFLQAGAGQVQGIYDKAAQHSAAFAGQMEGAMNASTGQVNAANNAVMAGINAPAGQYTQGDFGASAHIEQQAQNFGNLLAAQGADWAAYMAVQPGIYSKMAVYNIGKLLTESTRRLATLQAQKIGLSDEEANAYGNYLADLQKDQYNRRIDALKYQQEQDKMAFTQGQYKDKLAQQAWERKFKTWQEQQKNARFQAGLEASGLKTTTTTNRYNKTVDPTSSRAAGYLVNRDGTPHLIGGKKVKVQGPKAPGVGVVNLTASMAAKRWVDGHGKPVPGMAGIPVPQPKPGTKGGPPKPPTAGNYPGTPANMAETQKYIQQDITTRKFKSKQQAILFYLHMFGGLRRAKGDKPIIKWVSQAWSTRVPKTTKGGKKGSTTDTSKPYG